MVVSTGYVSRLNEKGAPSSFIISTGSPASTAASNNSEFPVLAASNIRCAKSSVSFGRWDAVPGGVWLESVPFCTNGESDHEPEMVGCIALEYTPCSGWIFMVRMYCLKVLEGGYIPTVTE